jgi:hypothetical protein
MSRLIPELDVSDLDRSLNFYVKVVGFSVLYDRPEERFAFLDLDGARPRPRVKTNRSALAAGRFAQEADVRRGTHERDVSALFLPLPVRLWTQGSARTGHSGSVSCK